MPSCAGSTAARSNGPHESGGWFGTSEICPKKHPQQHKINGKNTLLNRDISYIYISSISMGHFHLFSMAPLNHQRVYMSISVGMIL